MIKNTIRSAAIVVGKLIRRAGITLPERIFRHLHFEGPFAIAMPNGERLNLFSWANRVENELYWRGWDGHEKSERTWWVDLVKRGGDILDIGANTGTFAFQAKAMMPNARVIAFEPLSRVASRIKHNVEVSGLTVEVVQMAVADITGELPIFDPGGVNAYSASLDNSFLPGMKEQYTVPVVSVDSYCLEHDVDPGAIKIDVEGVEGRVICGAEQILSRRQVVILCEWLGSTDSHISAAALLKYYDYAALDITTLEPIGFTRNNTTSPNIIIAPTEIIHEIQTNMSSKLLSSNKRSVW